MNVWKEELHGDEDHHIGSAEPHGFVWYNGGPSMKNMVPQEAHRKLFPFPYISSASSTTSQQWCMRHEIPHLVPLSSGTCVQLLQLTQHSLRCNTKRMLQSTYRTNHHDPQSSAGPFQVECAVLCCTVHSTALYSERFIWTWCP